MRRLLAAAALVIALVSARPAASASADPGFAALQADLQARLATDFAEPLSAPMKARQKAFEKCVALLDGPSDIRTFIAVSRLLEKVFPEGMFAQPEDPEIAFRFLADSASGGFSMAFAADLSDLRILVFKVAPSPATRKAAKLLAAADRALSKDNPAASLYLHAKAAQKAWKSVLKALPLVQEAPLLPAPALDLTFNGVHTTGGTVSWTYHSKSRTVDLYLRHEDPTPGYHTTIRIQADLDSALTTATVSGGHAESSVDFTSDIFNLESATLEIGTFDLAGRQFTGSFSFTGLGMVDYMASGTFTATWYLEVVND